MEKLIVSGYLGKDATLKQSNGSEFISFTVANTRAYTNGQNERVEQTHWYNCIWSPRSKEVLKYLKKGTKVLLEGRPDYKIYHNSNNQAAIDVSLSVSNLELMGDPIKQNTDQGPAEQQQPPQQQRSQIPVAAGFNDSDNDVDLPF